MAREQLSQRTFLPVQPKDKVGASNASGCPKSGALDAVVRWRRVAGAAGAPRDGLVGPALEADQVPRALAVVVAVPLAHAQRKHVGGTSVVALSLESGSASGRRRQQAAQMSRASIGVRTSPLLGFCTLALTNRERRCAKAQGESEINLKQPDQTGQSKGLHLLLFERSSQAIYRSVGSRQCKNCGTFLVSIPLRPLNELPANLVRLDGAQFQNALCVRIGSRLPFPRLCLSLTFLAWTAKDQSCDFCRSGMYDLSAGRATRTNVVSLSHASMLAWPANKDEWSRLQFKHTSVSTGFLARPFVFSGVQGGSGF
jgi:hypothetical protein